VASLFVGDANLDKKRPVTISTQFKKQVTDLMANLMACTPHYCRCIKPNQTKAALTMDKDKGASQITYLGLFETVRVRRAGYCYRAPHDYFLQRYKIILERDMLHYQGDPLEGNRQLIANVTGSKGAVIESFKAGMKLDQEVGWGKTKMFVRDPKALFALEQLRNQGTNFAQVLTSKFVRGHIARNLARRRRHAIRFLQSRLRGVKARALFCVRHYVIITLQKLCRGANVRTKLTGKQRVMSSRIRALTARYMGVKQRRRDTVVRQFTGDYVGAASNASLQKVLSKHGDTGRIFFADRITKFNKKLKSEERAFVVTGNAVYNLLPELKKAKEQRAIALEHLSRVSMSPLADNFVVLHVPSEYDYLVAAEKKIELVSALRDAYRAKTGRRLEVLFRETFDYKPTKKPRTIRFVKDSELSPEAAAAAPGGCGILAVDKSDKIKQVVVKVPAQRV